MELLPVVAAAFAELGYRKATTAELARRCGVRENILYRLWPDKKTMFVASIHHLYDSTVAEWTRVLEQAEAQGGSAAAMILDYDARTRGDQGFYRITFAALSETDDEDVRTALRQMYRRFHRFITDRITEHRGADETGASAGNRLSIEATAWSIIGLATIADISNALGMMSRDKRRGLLATAGGILLDGPEAPATT